MPRPKKANTRSDTRAAAAKSNNTGPDPRAPLTHEAEDRPRRSCSATKKSKFEELFNHPLAPQMAWESFQRDIDRLTAPEPVPALTDDEEEMENKEVEVVEEGYSLRSREEGGSPSLAAKATASRKGKNKKCDEEEEDNRIIGAQMEESLKMMSQLLERYENSKKETEDMFEEERKDIDRHAKKMKEVAKSSEFIRATVPQFDQKLKLYDLHCRVIRAIPAIEIGKLCENSNVISELIQIRDGNLLSKRHEEFFKCGLLKGNIRRLSVAEPFNERQEHYVIEVIKRKVLNQCNLLINDGEPLHYISSVMVPEALIRIFALANNVSVEQSERELMYRAGYDGLLSKEILETIPILEAQGVGGTGR